LPRLIERNSLKCTDSKEKNKSRSGEHSKKLPDLSMIKNWNSKDLREKRELRKSDSNKMQPELSTKRDLRWKGSKGRRESMR
jgi:hypothetical protein